MGLQSRYEVESLGESSVTEEIEKRVAATSNTYSFMDIFVKKVDWELVNVEPESITNRFDILDL